MSQDFMEIMAAMSSVPDIQIDPNTGATMGSSGKTLGEKYQMEDKVAPAIADKIRKNAKLTEADKNNTLSTVDAYRELTGQLTSTQVKEHHQKILEVQQQAMITAQATITADAILEAHFDELAGQPQEIKQLNERVITPPSEDPMMDMYVNSINKKLKWK